MRLHTARLSARLTTQLTARLATALLAFAIGTGAASLRPARRQTAQVTTTEAATLAPNVADCPAPPAATVAVADTPKPDAPRVTQTVVTSFPTLGMVYVRAVENYGEEMRVEVLDVETDKLVASFPIKTSYVPEAGARFDNPFLRFRILRPDGLPRPLILAVAVTPGVSGHGFRAALIGEAGGRLKLLTDGALRAGNQSGIYVGDLGGGRGVGLALWSPIWDVGCEGHYSAHRIEFELYPFDSRRKRFRKGHVMTSKGKYGGHGEGALEELGLRYTDLFQDMPDVSEYHWL